MSDVMIICLVLIFLLNVLPKWVTLAIVGLIGLRLAYEAIFRDGVPFTSQSRARKQARLTAAAEVHRAVLKKNRLAAQRAKYRRPPIHGLGDWRWQQMLREADFRCAYCNRVFTRSHLVKEHDIPYSRGGAHHRDNIKVACKHCNSLKGTKTGEAYVDWLTSNPWALTWSLGTPRGEHPVLSVRRTAQDDLHDALRKLSRTTKNPIASAAIVNRAIEDGSTYGRSTLQATVSQMGASGRIHRISYGKYRLNTPGRH